MKQNKEVNIQPKKGKNKLEETVELLQKLNEEHFTKEELDTSGYPYKLTIYADGSGHIYNDEMGVTVYGFDSLEQLALFLQASTRQRFMLAVGQGYRAATQKKGNN